MRTLTLAREELGWTAQRGIEEMCEDSWRWQKNNQTDMKTKGWRILWKTIDIGVDVGGTSIKMGLFTTEGELLEKWEIPTRKENNVPESYRMWLIPSGRK